MNHSKIYEKAHISENDLAIGGKPATLEYPPASKVVKYLTLLRICNYIHSLSYQESQSLTG
ncbi:hypothetical protein J8TS2_38810 [Lederbergia ruris]|uniref:Uncharacterized protein n=2 Tax=Bacillaceae TaxID=186817 RepID=A0A917XX14_9BACI|nr:hypothetical protein GCM10007971_17350 [Oceanobacillus indicireducens]GIN59562.1 hypothetical protein J8TS2_38810 [Lederbergia ruris]